MHLRRLKEPATTEEPQTTMGRQAQAVQGLTGWLGPTAAEGMCFQRRSADCHRLFKTWALLCSVAALLDSDARRVWSEPGTTGKRTCVLAAVN